jgi:predicted nucleic acid-binding protein
MILVDTSVWVDHLRYDNPRLVQLLNSNQVLCHPFVVGELACGILKNRTELLTLLSQLPQAALAAETEVLFFIEQRNLMGRGIGYIDSLLLASVCLDGSVLLWTLDKRLAALAGELGINGEAGFYPR